MFSFGKGGFVWNWTSKVRGVEEFCTKMDNGGVGFALRLVETFWLVETILNYLIRHHWASSCAIIGGFQLLVQNKLFPLISCHFFYNALEKPLFTVKYYEFALKISEKHTKELFSVSYIPLNLNFHSPYNMLIDF